MNLENSVCRKEKGKESLHPSLSHFRPGGLLPLSGAVAQPARPNAAPAAQPECWCASSLSCLAATRGCSLSHCHNTPACQRLPPPRTRPCPGLCFGSNRMRPSLFALDLACASCLCPYINTGAPSAPSFSSPRRLATLASS
jgi:hypothetical protein